MQYFKNIFSGIYTALVGMKITLAHLFKKKVTMQYPDNYHPIKSGDMPSNSRNRIHVDMDDCNGCNSCARACPVDCISIDTVKVVPGDEPPPLKSGGKRALWVTKYDIDFGICCFCSLCTEACPTNAIMMTREFEYSTFDRNELLYHFGEMTPEEVKEKEEKFKKFQIEKKKQAAAKKAAEAKAAKEADKEGGDKEDAGKKAEPEKKSKPAKDESPVKGKENDNKE
ncbi:MAG: NuoI/complex I 23 kDa subunit family protein [Candidatus Kapaibacterium sp.]